MDDNDNESEEEYEGHKDSLMMDLEALAKGQHKVQFVESDQVALKIFRKCVSL